MNFSEIANARYSCRKYDPDRPVEQQKLSAILQAVALNTSAAHKPTIPIRFIGVCSFWWLFFIMLPFTNYATVSRFPHFQ